MGTTVTKPALSEEQMDVRHLASNYPFGDDELWKLYRCLRESMAVSGGTAPTSGAKISFLTDWAVACTRLSAEQAKNVDRKEETLQQLREEKMMLMQVVENKILPPGFSKQLSQAFFSDDNTAVPSFEAESDSSRLQRLKDSQRARLDKFFDGASNVGRRGGRKALAVMFDSCVSRQKKAKSPNDPFGADSYVVDAHELLDMGHRLSIASSFLEAAARGDEMGVWVPNEAGSETPTSGTSSKVAIESLSRSLVDFIKNKRMRQGVFGADLNDGYIEKGLVEKVDIQEWSDSNAPLLPATLSTFMHHVFFPEKPYPPSRTPFDYPKLDNESVFFAEPTSPLLFGFSCLSKSLGGMVRTQRQEFAKRGGYTLNLWFGFESKVVNGSTPHRSHKSSVPYLVRS